MVLFLFYVAIHELNMLFGHGELYRLFFSEAKLARRRRAHLVIRLNGLTEASSVEAISERSSPAYAELVDILCETRFGTVAVANLTHRMVCAIHHFGQERSFFGARESAVVKDFGSCACREGRLLTGPKRIQ
jgi:hypothetical protein